MSLAEIQSQAASLSLDERIMLAAFLASLRMKESGEWARAVQPDAADRAGWVSLDEARHRLLGGS